MGDTNNKNVPEQRTPHIHTIKDRANTIAFSIASVGLMGGALFAVGSIPIAAFAVGLSALVQFRSLPAVKARLQKTLNTPSDKPETRDDGLARKIAATREFLTDRSHIVKINVPTLHVLDAEPEDEKSEDTDKKQNGKKEKVPPREAILREFNKRANAAAFGTHQGHMMISTPLLKQVPQAQINAIAGHEMAHIAAKHARKRETVTMFTGAAKLSAGINALVTYISSFTNFGAFVAGVIGGGIATALYSKARGLDPKKNALHAQEFKVARVVAAGASVAGISIAMGAPQVAAAYGLSLAVKQIATLIQAGNSRRHEFQADRLGAEICGNPRDLCAGLNTVTKLHLEFERGMGRAPLAEQKGILASTFKFFSELYRTHPYTERRCRRLQNMAAKLDRA